MNPVPPMLAKERDQKWSEFLDTLERSGIEAPKPPETVSEIQHALLTSEFIFRTLRRNPSLFAELRSSEDVCRAYPEGSYAGRLAPLLAEAEDSAALGKILRRFREREMVRIAWRDLTGRADLFTTMAEMSALAEACIDGALTRLYAWECRRSGIPLSADGSQVRLVVVGMGKLGAHELNFSSDVDLIFAYARRGNTSETEHPITNEAFFTALCRQLIKLIGAVTENGFVFRVDTQLRPYGEGGPICMSFDAMEDYYQRQGREWERYAWIKARVIAGDRQAGEKLLALLKPFVYRRYLDYGSFESLRAMKQMIAVQVKRKGAQNDIKLGPGGIREIEFFGQMFQLIRGGVLPVLQRRRILEVLKVLVREKIVTAAAADQLSDAYVFLRNCEHRLQAYSDHQTHALPEDERNRARLALAMGFENWEAFSRQLEHHRSSVQYYFNQLLESRDSPPADSDDPSLLIALQSLWQGGLEQVQAASVMASAGFENPDQVIKTIDAFRRSPEAIGQSTAGRSRLDRLVPLVIQAAGRSSHAQSALTRMIELIRAIGRRTSYLALLLENQAALSHLIRLVTASPFIAGFLARHPVLLDELLDPRQLYRPPLRRQMRADLDQRLESVPDDLEYQIEALCIFKQVHVLRIAAADVTGELALMRVSDHLTDLAEIIVNQVVDFAWRHLKGKHGAPECTLDGAPVKEGFAIIAYGKLGGIELGYGSDLDLVFLHAGSAGTATGGPSAIDSPQFFNRLGQRVVHILTTHTPAGRLYDIDTRLRPSGSSGVLVSDMAAFETYQLQKAWTWEHQAMLRARAVGGDPVLVDRFQSIRKRVLQRQREPKALCREIVQMRQRLRDASHKTKSGRFDLKQGHGGIVDIEFLVQYLVLRHAAHFPELLLWTDNVRLLQTLTESGVLDEYAANILKHAYLIYRAAAHKLSLQGRQAQIPEEKYRHLRRVVVNIWNRFTADAAETVDGSGQ